DQASEVGVGGCQRITTAEDDLSDSRVGRDVVEYRPPALAPGQLVTARAVFRVGEVAAETVAAMDGAALGADQQHAALVLVQQAGGGGLAGFLQRIQYITVRFQQLGRGRENLQQQGVARVAPPQDRKSVV